MQGKLIIGAIATLLGSTGAVAGEATKRQPCPKTEQAQQRQQVQPQQQPQQRARPQGCSITRNVPPVVDPTPHFFL